MVESGVVGTCSTSVLDMLTYKEKVKFGFIDPNNLNKDELSPRSFNAIKN